MKKHCLLLLLFLFTASAFAQKTITVTGIVKEKATGMELIGVTIQAEGSTSGTITDFDGKYSIDVAEGTTLVFSYVGFVTEKRTVTANNPIVNVELDTEETALNEIVVVGYGTQRKRDVTGSIVSVSGEDLKASPDYNPVKALQGKVPGLLVTNSGTAGGSPTIRLRGVATVNASTNPLYVVDGLFVDNIDFVNPNDIESIEVLKDPSSLAIFGVQGANGVIIITTKRADEGKLSISYDGYGGAQMVHNRDRLQLTNADQFTELYNEQLKNMDPNAAEWTGDLLGTGTDWQSYILRPAAITNHGISITSATDKSNNVLSFGYFLQDGVVKYNSYSRYNLRYAGDYKFGKNFKIGGNVNLSRWDSDGATASVQNAAQALPTYSPYSPAEQHDPDNIGSYYNPAPSIQKDVNNPVAAMEMYKGTSESYGYRGVGNLYAEVRFLQDFTLRATGYADIGVSLGSAFTPAYDLNTETSNVSQKSEKTSFSRNAAEYKKLQADIVLNYNKEINKHRISAMLGYTARFMENQGFNASVDSLVSGDMWNVPEDFWMLNVGHNLNRQCGDWYEAESFISAMARINYAYANRYLLAATFRADASSKFSPKHRWGFFPSVGLGWVISEEGFMEDVRDDINFLKLKASWGQLGNDKIGNYLYFPTINPKGQQVVVDGVTYYIPTVNNEVDENIHWEVVSGFDVGVESHFFQDRLTAELGYYTKTTSDLLAYVAPSVSIGAGYAITNAGSIRNQGFEYMIGWHDQVGDFSYGISINGATLHNEVLSLGNNNADIISGLYHRTSVGHPVGAIYGYVQDGIFQNQQEIDDYYPASWTSKPGDIRYKDLNGDGKITDADRDFIGTTIPTFTYGMSLNFGYKGFDLALDFNGVTGNSIVNTKKLPTYAQFNYYMYTYENRWHGEGTSNKEPILDTSRGHNFLPSTNLLESGAYFRLRAVQLGYNLPQSALKKMKCQKFRIFVNAQNPLTFKSSTGYTPEVGGGILDGGVDNGGTYPIPSVYTGGISVSF